MVHFINGMIIGTLLLLAVCLMLFLLANIVDVPKTPAPQAPTTGCRCGQDCPCADDELRSKR